MIEGQPEQPAAVWTLAGCKIDSRPQRGWWAPGSYMNKCVECGEGFIGDKRAGWCADCAYREAAAESEKPPVADNTVFACSALVLELAKRFERRAEDIKRISKGNRDAEVMAAIYTGLAYDLRAEIGKLQNDGSQRLAP